MQNGIVTMENDKQAPQKIKHEIITQFINSTPGIYPAEMKAETPADICNPLFYQQYS